MTEKAHARRAERRAREHDGARRAILEAARRLAGRGGERVLSLRGVAAEAGYAPAALYGYFRNRSELIVALAAEDLSALCREMRDAARSGGPALGAALKAAFDYLCHAEWLAASTQAFDGSAEGAEVERLFNGRLIAALSALSASTGGAAERGGQQDVLLIAASLAGLAVLARSGRLEALGFTSEEILARLETRFRAPS